MKLYIRSSAAISPQKTFGGNFPEEVVLFQTNRLRAIEPDYKEWIDPKLIRRMSRIIRMGVTTANACLKEAGLQQPDAIISGTAYGCLEDTGLFLGRMAELNEEMLSPTSFIQSTHNTVAAQIALLNHCHNYNNTFVHRGFSFESALMDASMLLAEHNDHQILVGGVDEITDYSFNILARFGLYKSNLTAGIFDSATRGTIAGEGASFFVLGAEPSSSDQAILEGFTTCYKPSSQNEIEEFITDFLSAHQLSTDDIDLVITGKNGDHRNDEWFKNAEQIFNKSICVNYKNLCGEYPTAAAFALWYAINIIKSGSLKAAGLPIDKKFKKILIWNHYLGIHHSLFLVSAC
jgi:3-oxoacyl-[acyl-carrier-protein] synthase II